VKKSVIVGLAVLVLALDWAALDDITTGHETSSALEYGMLLLSVPVLGFAGWMWRRLGTSAIGH